MSHSEPLTRIHQLLARQAGSQPDAICLYEEGGGILTYAQLWQRAEDAARWLAAAGVTLNDLVTPSWSPVALAVKV